jgi:hypothetical protein
MSAYFDDKTIADFLRRSYFAVDGLWFVKTEEKRSFEDALELDNAVWRIMPKIQARKARELLGIDGCTLDDLLACLELKFSSEGYNYEINKLSDKEAEIVISACPWHSILVKSGRDSLAAAVADVICSSEFNGWSDEFSGHFTPVIKERLCDGGSKCIVGFILSHRKD